jgi:hypothetical protein
LEVPFSYFTTLDMFAYWRNFEILKKRVYRVLGQPCTTVPTYLGSEPA